MSNAPSTSIGPKKLTDLMKACRGYEADMDTSRDGRGQAIAQAVEKDGLDRKVFSLIRRLDKLSPEKLAAWHDTFTDYFVKSGLLRRAESAPSMNLDQSENEADGFEKEAAASKPKRTRKPKNDAITEGEGDEDEAAAFH